ncbi:hypothetical protein GC175_17155 [bacterium]|nr:hypothetical protein [bacterium]
MTDMLALGKWYITRGINVIPLGADKRPITTSDLGYRIGWKQWQTDRQTVQWLDVLEAKMPWWPQVKGFAGISGPVSGDLVCMDFDGTSPQTLGAFLDALAVSLDWVVESPGGGNHFWCRCPGLELEKGKLDRAATDGRGHVELRFHGHYTALPGSQHPNGGTYTWAQQAWPDSDPPTIRPEQLLAAYEAITVKKETRTVTPVPKTNGHQPYTNGAQSVSPEYAKVALEQELDELARAVEGGRNDALNRAAFSLGQLVGDGLLYQGEVADQLLGVALLIGLEEGESVRTIASGLGSGMQNPRGLIVGKPQAYTNGTQAHDPTPTVNQTEMSDPWTQADRNELLAWLARQPQDDDGNALCAQRLYGDRVKYCASLGWLHYNGKQWETDNHADLAVERLIVNSLRDRMQAEIWANPQDPKLGFCKPNHHRIKACMSLLQALVPVQAQALDAHPDLLNVQNGVVNLRTGELLPHDPDLLLTYCLPVDYDPNADTNAWQEWLAGTVAGGQEMTEWMQTALGYTLTGHTREECLVYIHGPTRSGKGTLTETLLTILGHPLSTEVDFGTFADRKYSGDSQNFDLAPLRPARAVFASESDKYERLNEAKIKLVTGGNMIRCAFKYRDFFSYRPQFKIWLSSNYPVRADPDDAAVWGRIRIVEFPHSHIGHEDKTLKERMKKPENLSSVLTWMVQGAIQWYAKGLSVPDSMKQTVERHRTDLDYLAQWLEDNTTSAPLKFTSSRDLYQDYKEWCLENGVTPKAIRTFSLEIQSKGFEWTRGYVEGKQARGFAGIRLGQEDDLESMGI